MITNATFRQILWTITGGSHICPACRHRVTNGDGLNPTFRLDWQCRSKPYSEAAATWSVIAWLCGVPS